MDFVSCIDWLAAKNMKLFSEIFIKWCKTLSFRDGFLSEKKGWQGAF